METEAKPVEKRRWNWWKIAFFVLLVVFEFTREIGVIEGSRRPIPNGNVMVVGDQDFASVRGRWVRTDGGDRLVPSVVSIECRRDIGRCVETSVNIIGNYVHIPDVDWFEAQFTPEAVTYENDLPACAKYSVRIDLRMRRVTGLRERKNVPTNPDCARLERRVEMQVSDANQPVTDVLAGHFVPMLQLIAAFM